MPKTLVLSSTQPDISSASDLLKSGELVAIPTETVYGLAADARDDRAVARIFEVKGRPSFNPLIVHIKDLVTAEKIARFNDDAYRLAEAFWPGSLTLVLPLRPEAGISPLVTAGLETVALRIPAHSLAQKILSQSNLPLAAPSANPSSRISPTRASHVIDGFEGRIAAVVDGGACRVGLESTIVGLFDGPSLLRPGGIPIEAIEDCLGFPLRQGAHEKTPTAPGQLSLHYAPTVPLRLNAPNAREGEILLGFGKAGSQDWNLSHTGDLVEAAANLFHYLRKLDAQGQPIAVSPIPENGLGRAINDRLRRAAAPRN